jgi:hypothetical protein
VTRTIRQSAVAPSRQAWHPHVVNPSAALISVVIIVAVTVVGTVNTTFNAITTTTLASPPGSMKGVVTLGGPQKPARKAWLPMI